jgi:hypothetical protein
MRTIEVEEPKEARPDPMRPTRRLAAAILAQAAADFVNSRDLHVWRDAEQFLFPQRKRR